MHRFAEPVPESRLADVLMGELFPRPEIDDTFVDLVLDDLDLADPGACEDYAAYEIVRDAFATTEFVRVRDTRYDHIVTVEFPRDFTRDVLGVDTAPVAKVSSPYERIEVENEEDKVVVERISLPSFASGEIAQAVDLADDEMQLDLDDLEIEQDLCAPRGAQFMAYAHARPFPLYSAPFERVELGELPLPAAAPEDSTDLVAAHAAGSSRVVVLALVLISAIAAAIGLALLVVRSATA